MWRPRIKDEKSGMCEEVAFEKSMLFSLMATISEMLVDLVPAE